jgi:hypothetical protein
MIGKDTTERRGSPSNAPTIILRLIGTVGRNHVDPEQYRRALMSGHPSLPGVGPGQWELNILDDGQNFLLHGTESSVGVRKTLKPGRNNGGLS